MNHKKVLHNNDGLEITFIVEDGLARLEFRSNPLRCDLATASDLVVVLDGKGFEVESSGHDFAVAKLGDWAQLTRDALGALQLMIRVHEFFDGWELDES